MTALFTYNDTVKVTKDAPEQCRPGELASVVSISLATERGGEFLKEFPHGVVYSIEFEDGCIVEIHEDFVEKGAFPSELGDRGTR
ncbi:MAG: hypothetical protein WD100_03305 [Tistlia sp.]|uniref:hypothetical protein n=1 Tax=Tistlia sp. TaxID=3057121 RepID=UPI0034A48033